MKKLAIASLFALGTLTSGAASALDFGISMVNEQRQDWGVGIQASEKYGKVTFSGGLERFTNAGNDQTRFGVVAGYDVTKINNVTVTGKVGIAYLDNSEVSNGWATTLGFGVRMPITKAVTAFADYRYQWGQGSVDRFDGSAMVLGINVKF
jgi:opacity protein-like surface antigen